MSEPDLGETSAAGGGYIQLRDVHKRFRAVHAVRGVTFDVRQNEFVTLLGPSGCGKTTLLRLIGGLDRADSGTIVIDGLPVNSTPQQHRRTRMVFQQYALFPHMTVGQNVEFGLRMRKMPSAERRERVQSVLEMAQLADKAEARPRQLSGGQQQRVALARALVTEPTVLLLDEPLAALDLQLRKSMQLELKNLQQSLGITFVYVTHDQGEALTMSDRVVVMRHGEIEQIGSGEEIYDRPATSFVARFIGEANVLEGRIVDTDDTDVVIDIDGTRISLPLPPDSRAATGTTASFMVRPERMVIGRSMAPGQQGLNGRVLQRLYLGSTTRFVVGVSSERQILVDVAHPLAAKVSQDVVVGWTPDSIRWLK